MRIAVVTGASSGIGREFALRLGNEEGIEELWAIARRRERLKDLIPQCRARVRVLDLDLLCSESFEKLEHLLRKDAPQIAYLVNAAGFGLFGTFQELSLKEQLDMISLNVGALTALTHLCLPYMKKGGRIFQMSSLSAFQPLPFVGVYGAGKAYVLRFSRALNRELRPRKVGVTAVCPGWTKTAFFDRAANSDAVCVYDFFFTPARVVDKALADGKKGRDLSVCGVSVYIKLLLSKILPHRLIMKLWCLQQKKERLWERKRI